MLFIIVFDWQVIDLIVINFFHLLLFSFFFAALSITVDCFSNIFPDPNDRMRHIYLCLGLKVIASMNIKRKYINKDTRWRLRIFELRNQYECYKENIDQVDKSFFRSILSLYVKIWFTNFFAAIKPFPYGHGHPETTPFSINLQ